MGGPRETIFHSLQPGLESLMIDLSLVGTHWEQGEELEQKKVRVLLSLGRSSQVLHAGIPRSEHREVGLVLNLASAGLDSRFLWTAAVSLWGPWCSQHP